MLPPEDCIGEIEIWEVKVGFLLYRLSSSSELSFIRDIKVDVEKGNVIDYDDACY